MKRVLIISSCLVLALICIMIILNVRTGRDVKANINMALAQYSGSAEDALLTMLQDEIHKAISSIEKGRLFSHSRMNK